MLAFYLSIIETEKERDSFSAIYDNYLDWMLKVAYHFSGNIHDAEEIVHDVFMNIAEYNISVPTKNEDETKAYLFICIRNKAISVLKQKGRITTVSIDDFFDITSEEIVEDCVAKTEEYTEIDKFISTMKPIYRDALTLHFFYEKSLVEISKILNVPLNTVSTRIKRGKAILKERFKDLDI